MSLLNMLRGKSGSVGSGKPKQATPPGAQRRASAANAPTVKAPVAPLRQPQQRSVVPPPVYKSLSELPPHTAVASQDGGRFELSQNQRQHMFILELSGLEDTFAVITTKDYFGSASYKAALERIESAGCKTHASGTADGALIVRVNKDRREEGGVDEKTNAIIKDIEKLAQAALESDASDIHIESRGGGVMVRMRINGRLQNYSDSWGTDYAVQFGRALFSIADDDSKPTGWSTDCQMSVSRTLPSGARVKLRVQVSPAYPDEGMDVVIRVLRVAASAKVKSLEALGYAPDHIDMLEYMLTSPHGLIVIAGTTGSGKSTTLQTAMQNIRRADLGRKLVSIEDPPEYVLEGVTQIPVSRPKDKSAAAGPQLNPFAAAMRNTMRMDPDVIMIGEIRDVTSAELMVAMVQSGHKVLTTIHTESALGIFSRLRGMNVQSDVMAGRGFISGLIFQTLVPTLCKHCRVDYHPGMEELPEALHERIRAVVKEGDTLFIESENGCEHCNHTGIAGRTVCAEMVIPDGTLRDFVLSNSMKEAHHYWRGQRAGKPADSMMGATALDHAILKMRRGEVSPTAVEGALGLLNDFSLDSAIVGEAGDLLGLGC